MAAHSSAFSIPSPVATSDILFVVIHHVLGGMVILVVGAELLVVAPELREADAVVDPLEPGKVSGARAALGIYAVWSGFSVIGEGLLRGAPIVTPYNVLYHRRVAGISQCTEHEEPSKDAHHLLQRHIFGLGKIEIHEGSGDVGEAKRILESTASAISC